MPRCCFTLFATAKKTRLGYDSSGGKHKGEGKTAVDSPSLYQHKGKLIALSSLPCPAPICEPFRDFVIVCDLVFSPQKRDKKINERVIAGIFYLPFWWLYCFDSLRLAISKNIYK